MNSVCRLVLAAAAAAVICEPGVAFAQAAPPPAQPTAQQTQPPAKPEEQPKYEETVVVTGAKTEQKLIDAAATMSVVSSAVIEMAPSQNFAELLRTIPGVNITQVSARDINITSRSATGTLATGQLALLDGRSLYQDFFGFVMWDFLPVNLNEIKQIEVIRGPASAVWGANALNGVVNVIMKSPREIQGESAVLGFGGFERVGQDAGTVWYISGTHARVINDRLAYKVSAGAYSQDPLSRPTGVIPGSPGTTYPPFVNTGTTQPKFDGRVDYDYEDGRKLSFSGGVAGTEGIMHTGIGPFDINSGTVMGYAKANYSQRALRVGFFTNILRGDASNLLTRDIQGRPIAFTFDTNTFDFEISNVQSFAARHVVSYGGNLRQNNFKLSLASESDDRTEFGVYAQDEIFLSDKFRWTIGARVDRFDFLDNFVLSPRTAVVFKPQSDQAIRFSYNRAYRSPSVINNWLDITLVEPIPLSGFAFLNPALLGQSFPLPIRSVGSELLNEQLKEQVLDAFEVGYTGAVGRGTTVSAAFYVNRTKNEILFTEVTSARYSALNPPPNWTAITRLPPLVIAAIPPNGTLPALFTYRNFGRVNQKGLELGVDSVVNDYLGVFVNYSWQGEPDPQPRDQFPLTELNLPPRNRFNAGASVNYGRYFGNFAVNFTDDAFWQDVLDARYHGTTDSYTLVNAGFGVRWADDKVTTAVKIVNLLNDNVQQHVFGDILKRQIVGEFRINFPR
jgi:outer membrane receptor protein involved in Fe transport